MAKAKAGSVSLRQMQESRVSDNFAHFAVLLHFFPLSLAEDNMSWGLGRFAYLFPVSSDSGTHSSSSM